MKIAIWHNLPSGGGKRALYYHVKGLVQRGHTVESWCSSTADQLYLPLSDLIRENVIPLPWKDRPIKSFISKVRLSIFDTISRLKAMDTHCRKCAEHINAGGYDLLFANSSIFLAVAPIAKYVNIPKILYLQEPSRQLYEAMPKWPWIRPDFPREMFSNPRSMLEYFGEIVRIKYFENLAREEWINIKAYDLVLANSLYSRESMLRAYGINAQVCYLGIDNEVFKYSHLQRDNFIVGVGSFTPLKNIEFIIKALGSVGNPRPRLVWVGNQSYPNYLDGLKQLARSLNVDFEPREMISDDEMIDLYNRAAMMAYAPRLEPFGYTPLEANACGLPVVAVAEGGVRETIIDGINGLLVEPNEKAMARAIERLRDDKELAYTLGQNGRKLVAEKWSFNGAIDRIEKQLKDALKKV